MWSLLYSLGPDIHERPAECGDVAAAAIRTSPCPDIHQLHTHHARLL